MKKTLLAIVIALSVVGCASNDYKAYADAQANVATARANADTARYQALTKIAETGDGSAKIAAVMALALGTNNVPNTNQVQAPQASQALQWASILVPSVTTLASINANMRVGLANSETSARIAESTNNTFLGVASKIQAPVATQANITTTTTTTSTDNHAISTDSHAVSTTNTTANPTTTSTSIGGAGVIGDGTYTTQANPVTNTTTNPATTGVVCGVSVTGTVNCIP